MGASRGSPIPIPLPLPFFQDATAGEQSISQLLRKAEKDRYLLALLIYVNSPGGSPLA